MKFQDPPNPKVGARRVDHKAIREELMQHPGQWALVIEGAKSHSNANPIRTYKPLGQFEATGRIRSDKLIDVYARFVGGAE